MSRNFRVSHLVGAAALCLVAHRSDAALIFSSSGGLTIINDRSVFESQFPSVEVETFESFPATQNAMLNQAFDFGFYSVSNDIDTVIIPDRAGHIEFDGGIGSQGLDVHLSTGDGTVTISMIQPVMSFGFDVFSWANGGRPGRLALDNGEFIDITNGDDGVSFWGIVSDTRFSSLTFSQTSGAADGLVLDDFTLGEGSVVPEPSYISFMLLTLSGVYAVRRHRKQQMCK